MPIPHLLPPEEMRKMADSAPKFLPVLAQQPAFHGFRPAHLAGRAMAYLIDILVVSGFSVYGAKIFSLLLIAGHMGEIHGAGKLASEVFEDTFSLAQMQLFLGAFLVFGSFYFVVLPRFVGRTLGLGLMGMKIVGADGRRPGFKAMLLRQLGCAFQYASGGLMYLQVLKGPAQPMLQDSLSHTRVVEHR